MCHFGDPERREWATLIERVEADATDDADTATETDPGEPAVGKPGIETPEVDVPELTVADRLEPKHEDG